MGGKDGDGIIRISLYLIEYQKIKIPLKNKFEWSKWNFRKISGYVTDYLNICSISLANFWLLSLGKSETGSLYLDL